MKESPKHERAFEIYYGLGARRSLTAVANKVGVSRSAVRDWSREFTWAERVNERDRGIARVAADKALQEGIESGTRNRRLVQLALVQAAKQIAAGKVRCTIADLDRLIRLEAFLEGKADSRQEVISRDLASRSTAELRIMLRKEISDLAELAEVVEVDGELGEE